MGWPRGKPRKKVLSEPVQAQAQKDKDKSDKPDWKQRAGNDWKATEFLERVRGYDATNWRERTHDDRLSLPQETLDYLQSHQLDAQWITESVFGQRQDQRWNAFLANGWVPVEPDTIPGVSTGELDGVRLCVRPLAISEKARKAEYAAATAQWDTQRQFLKEGIALPSGAGAHPNAIHSNKLNRTLERLDIPRD
jgi:hypothetical protein